MTALVLVPWAAAMAVVLGWLAWVAFGSADDRSAGQPAVPGPDWRCVGVVPADVAGLDVAAPGEVDLGVRPARARAYEARMRPVAPLVLQPRGWWRR